MPSKIEWCDETINPQGWGCWGPGGTPEEPKRCWYCYVERQARGPYVPACPECKALRPHWHPERLEQPYRWKKPRRIFWQSMGDLFHRYTPVWQIQVIKTLAEATPQHSHIFCTKNPARYQEFNPWPANCWLLTSITDQDDANRRIPELVKADASVLGVSAEPMLGEIEIFGRVRPNQDCHYIDDEDGTCGHPDNITPECHIGSYCPTESVFNDNAFRWLIIGAYTGKGASRFRPNPAWVQSIIDQGRAGEVPVFLKDNLHWPEKIQEWPL